MSVIVGARYNDGIVMASDLLQTTSGRRTEQRKLYFTNNLVVGVGGISPHIFLKRMKNDMDMLFREFSVPLLVDSVLPQYFHLANRVINSAFYYPEDYKFSPDNLHYLAALIAYYDNEFGIRCYNFEKPQASESPSELSINPKIKSVEYSNYQKVDDIAVLHPGKEGDLQGFDCSITDMISAKDTIISLVKHCNKIFPDECDGLHVLNLNRNGVEEVAYESIAP